MWTASCSSGLQVGGVKGGVGFCCEDQGSLRLDDNLLPLLRIRLPPGGVWHVRHNGPVRRPVWEVLVTLFQHRVQVSRCVDGVDEERLVSPFAARLVRAVVVLQRPSAGLERVARDVAAIAEHFLPALRVLCHVVRVDELPVLLLVKHSIPSVAPERRDIGCWTSAK
jgi:hypothetical protein